MVNLYNFKINKNNYFNNFVIFWQILPKQKNYVITKILKLDKTQLIKLLKHFKSSKNIKFIKNKLITWLDYE